MKIKLSIVVPMYNAEEYVKEMLDSALDGVDESVEVIVVDDGSTDGSYQVVESYPDSRVHLYSQPNSGAPAARNNGLGKAKGEYVLFFDADDFFVKGAVRKILKRIAKSEHDLYVGNMYRYDGKEAKLEFKDMNWLRTTYDYYMGSPSPNSKVYRRSILIENQIQFEGIRLAQDLNFYLKFLGVSQDIQPLNFPFFYYRYVGNSISHITNDRILDIGKSIKLAIAFYDRHNVSKECYSYAYLAGVKHTNYQLVKLKDVEDAELIRTLYPKMVRIWNGFFKRAKLGRFDLNYLEKKWIDAAIQMLYRFRVKKQMKALCRKSS